MVSAPAPPTRAFVPPSSCRKWTLDDRRRDFWRHSDHRCYWHNSNTNSIDAQGRSRWLHVSSFPAHFLYKVGLDVWPNLYVVSRSFGSCRVSCSMDDLDATIRLIQITMQSGASFSKKISDVEAPACRSRLGDWGNCCSRRNLSLGRMGKNGPANRSVREF